MNISEGSLDELTYYFILSNDLEYITNEEYEQLNCQCEEVSKLLSAYATAIRNSSKP